MQMLFVTGALAQIALAGGAATAEPAPTAANPAPAASVGPPQRICKTIKTLGSRLAKRRYCATREEWAERQLDDRKEVEKLQSQVCVVNGTNCK